jgi:hypothetical protein
MDDKLSERDTHFNSFAVLQFDEVKPLMREWEQANREHNYAFAQRIEGRIQDDLAKRAYDLVRHTIFHINPYWLDALDFDEIPARIPDMTEWPTPSPE